MSIIAGILTGLCFPKFNLYFLAFVALIPLLIDIKNRTSPREAAMSGFIFGVVFFGINLFWVNTLNHFAPVFAALGYVILVCVEAGFAAIGCYFIKYFSAGSAPGNIIITALIWTLIEWARTVGPFGVSAGDLGYSQASFLPLAQLASYITVFGISFIIVMYNAALTEAIARNDRTILIMAAAALVAISVLGQMMIPEKINASGKTLKFAVIQGNIPQDMKLNARFNDEIFSIHEQLTRSIIHHKPDLIIWPESVIFAYLADDPYFFPRLKKLAKDANAYILTGTPFYSNKSCVFNSIICISPSGEITGRYDKQRVVPFGEYLPFRALLFPILKLTGFFYRDFDFGRKDAQMFDIKGIKIGAGVCFESTFGDLFRERAGKGGQLFLTVTNDAWFGNSSAPYDHFNCGIFRAIENRRWFIQCANTGISGVIDPYGRTAVKAGVGERKALTFEIPLP